MKIEELAKAQKDIVGWNFYQERQHVEGLFYSRFNFFLVFYGMFIAAIATLAVSSIGKEYPYMTQFMLSFGVIILMFMQYTLYNVHQTLQLILSIIDNLPDYHSSPIISCLRVKEHTGFIISVIIPLICISSLLCILCYLTQYNSTMLNILQIFPLLVFIMYLYDHNCYIKKLKENIPAEINIKMTPNSTNTTASFFL